jgi:hypothetical protein
MKASEGTATIGPAERAVNGLAARQVRVTQGHPLLAALIATKNKRS